MDHPQGPPPPSEGAAGMTTPQKGGYAPHRESPKRFSPTRIGRADLRDSLKAQMQQKQELQRSQPKHVTSKIGVDEGRYNISPNPRRAARPPSPPSMLYPMQQYQQQPVVYSPHQHRSSIPQQLVEAPPHHMPVGQQLAPARYYGAAAVGGHDNATGSSLHPQGSSNDVVSAAELGGGGGGSSAFYAPHAQYQRYPDAPTGLGSTAGTGGASGASFASPMASAELPPGFGHSPVFGRHHRRRQVEVDQQVQNVTVSQELSNHLIQQMHEKEARKKQEYERERQKSRERLRSSLAFGITGPENGATTVGHTDARDSVAAGGSMIGMVVPPKSITPLPARVSPNRDPNATSVRVEDIGPKSKRASPERGREIAEWNMLSPTKLFDLEQRQMQEERLRRQRLDNVGDHRTALEEQIRFREEQRRKEREDSIRMDMIMEERARREAEQLALAERQRLSEAERLESEARQTNLAAAEHPSPAPVPAKARSTKRPSMLDDASHLPPSSKPSMSPYAGAGVGNVPSPVRVHIRDEGTQVDSSTAPMDDENNDVDLSAGRSHPVSLPNRFTPPPRRGVQLQQSPFALMQEAPYPDEAMMILQRNRDRLNALRYAGHHDDILKAFLLQESTAAVRSVSLMKDNLLQQ